MERIFDRIDQERYLSALGLRAKNAPFVSQKAYPEMLTMLELCVAPESTIQGRHLQVLWYVCVATGNRVENLYHANFLVDGDYLVVFFGKRKVSQKPREGLEIPLRWSYYPLPWMLPVLEEVSNRYCRDPNPVAKCGWRIHARGGEYPRDQHSAAGRICEWLRRHNRPWTSMTPRGVMSTYLHSVCTIDETLKEHGGRASMFLDHCERTGRTFYVKRARREVDEYGMPIEEPLKT